jgi:hypothetical protein
MFGADITLRWLLQTDKVVIDEMKVRNLLDTHLEENGGKVKAYTLVSGSMRSLMNTGGRERVGEFVIGSGLSEEKDKID